MLLEAIAMLAIESRDLFEGISCASLIYGYANGGVANRHEDLFMAFGDTIADGISARSLEFNTQEFSNLIWSYATAGYQHDRLMRAIVQAATPRAPECDDQHIANIAWASAKLRIRDDDLLAAFETEALRRLRAIDNQALSNILLAYASIGYSAPEMFEELGAEISQRRDANPQEIANSIWALAIAPREQSQAQAVPQISASSTVPELRALCKERGLSGYSKAKKADLVEMLGNATPAH